MSQPWPLLTQDESFPTAARPVRWLSTRQVTLAVAEQRLDQAMHFHEMLLRLMKESLELVLAENQTGLWHHCALAVVLLTSSAVCVVVVAELVAAAVAESSGRNHDG